ncbi:DUF819 family protein [Acidiluteibacter ferrifornacis]|uniref:DUF819 family protein n=1 Tax=Acidiluteibacter ferrifornacis TaxID=2692424 RepID=A0A6N9NNQ9_9FLAO|nr:DUF819 family protein [Acidiluteibacter ferrifornacis]MBR9833190.1 DUF819 family protein [bacterium]NBG66737.1 DUF819 family protein [Acidiluteibacter ferrifornacis]
MEKTVLITNDAVILGILMIILAVIFVTSSSQNKTLKRFYTVIPALLLCYFVPSLLNTFGIVDAEASNLYYVASRYLLPASLVLLCLSIDIKGILKLGPKAVIMFLTGTLGIILGGPIAILVLSLFSPDLVGGAGPDEVWRGLSTVAGSWIGGGANQTAMKEIYGPSDELFSAMVTVDVIVANIWMAFLLYGAGISERVDKFLKADSSAIAEVKKGIEDYRSSVNRNPSVSDMFAIIAIGFGGTALAHFGSDLITPFMEQHQATLDTYRLSSLASGFFWLVIIATIAGLALSFTKLKSYEGAGASKFGSVFLYVLVATIGMKMDVTAIFDNLGFFAIGLVWMLVHVIVLLVVAKLIKAPFFFVAVGSQANVGGAASAPIVASAFSSSLAPVGVLLAVFGYAVGTFGAIFCAQLMEIVSP